MVEVFLVLSLFVALVWVVARTVLILVRSGERQEQAPAPADPISRYVDENYGSHFVDDPVSINHSMRRL